MIRRTGRYGRLAAKHKEIAAHVVLALELRDLAGLIATQRAMVEMPTTKTKELCIPFCVRNNFITMDQKLTGESPSIFSKCVKRLKQIKA